MIELYPQIDISMIW